MSDMRRANGKPAAPYPPLGVIGPTVPYKGGQIPVATPRRIRLRRDGDVYFLFGLLLFVTAAFVLLIVSALLHITINILNGESLDSFTLWGGGVLIAATLGVWHWALRDIPLLTTGELTLARVIRRGTRIAAASYSYAEVVQITYLFRPRTGCAIFKTSDDLTGSFYQGMEVPVFYDRNNPKRNVALCSTSFEVLP